MFKLTWKQIYKTKLPSKQKKVERTREYEAFFIDRPSAEKAIDSTPPELQCFDFEITEVPSSAFN